jgi:hypothetical protein
VELVSVQCIPLLRCHFFLTYDLAVVCRSCWLELAELCVAEKQPLPTWQEITLPSPTAPRAQVQGQGQGRGQGHSEVEGAKVMYACFLVHAYLEKHCGDLAMQVTECDVLTLCVVSDAVCRVNCMPRCVPRHCQLALTSSFSLAQRCCRPRCCR